MELAAHFSSFRTHTDCTVPAIPAKKKLLFYVPGLSRFLGYFMLFKMPLDIPVFASKSYHYHHCLIPIVINIHSISVPGIGKL